MQVDSRLAAAPPRTLLACPPGRYAARTDAVALLHEHWRGLVALGYRPRSTRRGAARRALARGFLTVESGLWPRPAYCFAVRGPRAVHDVPPGTCEPDGLSCDKYRISRRYGFVWHHVWKGGTTSVCSSCSPRPLHPTRHHVRGSATQMPVSHLAVVTLPLLQHVRDASCGPIATPPRPNP